jgi:hypothetical protein
MVSGGVQNAAIQGYFYSIAQYTRTVATAIRFRTYLASKIHTCL